MYANLMNRRGLTLTEVLISFLVMMLGIISVIALFPVGVARVRRSVLDTRSTVDAVNSYATVAMHNWPDESELLQPPYTAPPLPPDQYEWNAYVAVPKLDRSGPVDVIETPGQGYPVYVDPILASYVPFQGPIVPASNSINVPPYSKRIAIRATLNLGTFGDYVSFAPFLNTLHDLPVFNLLEVREMDVANRLEPYLHRWFYSDADLRFEEANPVIPLSPRRRALLPPAATPSSQNQPNGWEYVQQQSMPTDSLATATRSPGYSWAFAIVGRTLSVPPGGGKGKGKAKGLGNGQGEPKAWGVTSGLLQLDPWNAIQVYVLVFRNRNLADPYRLVRGAFFDGSSSVTLSWPTSVARPEIKRGTWLVECTNTGHNRSTATTVYRNGMSFHRVASYEDPVFVNNEWHQVIALEQPFRNDGLGDFLTHPLGDLRPLPDGYSASTFPWNRNAPPTVLWVPVILFDGLLEVFQVTN